MICRNSDMSVYSFSISSSNSRCLESELNKCVCEKQVHMITICVREQEASSCDVCAKKTTKKKPHKTANHPAPGRKMQIRKMKARLHRTEHTKCDGAMMAIKL